MASTMMRRVIQNSSLTIGLNFGILSLSSTLNMTPNEMIDAAKVARSGSSVLNVQGDADLLHRVIEALVDADILAGCRDVIEKVDNLEWHATMVRPGELRSTPFNVAGLPNDVKIMLSVALSIGTVAGLDVAVIVVRSLLRKLQNRLRVPASSDLISDTHVDFAVRGLYNDLKSGGQTAILENHCAFYDEQSGLKWGWQYGHRYRDNITKALECLTDWAFDCTLPADHAHCAGKAKQWATRSAKVHKACFMLEKMGWKVRAESAAAEQGAGISTSATTPGSDSGCLFLETGTPLGLEFMEVVKAEGNAPKRLRGNGGGVMVPLRNLVNLVSAALISGDTRTQAAVELAWELGEKKGKLCRVVRGVYEHRCTYELCHPAPEARSQEPRCKWAAMMLVKVGSKASEFAEDFHHICGASKNDYEELRNSDVLDWDLDSPTVWITLGYLIGFIYGEVYRLAKDIQLLACFEKVFISWLDSPREFVESMHAILIPAEHEDGMSFTEVCRVIAAAYCGDAMSILPGGEQRDCVGMWTRRGLLLMAGVLDPTANFWHCSNAMLLPDWPLNLLGRDIYVISANRYFGSESGIHHFLANSMDLFKPVVHVTRPSTDMSIGCSPNLMDDQGTNMHCMFADGHLMYSGPIMATVASLHNAVAPCVCGGDPRRKSTCTRDDMFVVTDQDLMEERMYVSETYKPEQERITDFNLPPEKLQTNSKGVVLVHNNPKWAYAAASVYIDAKFLLAGSCLSCALDQTEHIVIQCGDSCI